MERSEQLQAGPSASSRCPILPDTAFCFDPNALRRVRKIAQLVDKVFKMHSDPRLFSSTPLIGMLRCIVTRAATTNWRNGRLRNIMSNDAQAYLNGSVRGELRGRRRARRRIGDDFISSSCHRRLALAREHAQEETRYNKLTWTDTTKRIEINKAGTHLKNVLKGESCDFDKLNQIVCLESR